MTTVAKSQTSVAQDEKRLVSISVCIASNSASIIFTALDPPTNRRGGAVFRASNINMNASFVGSPGCFPSRGERRLHRVSFLGIVCKTGCSDPRR